MTRQPRFRLEARDRPERAVRHAALAQIDYAQALLRQADANAVHETRKVCKKLRSLLRLVRPALGSDYRRSDHRLRNAARALSRSRGVVADQETLERLLEIDPGSFNQLPALRRRRPAPDTARACAKAARLLDDQRGRIERWKLSRLASADLFSGTVAGYRRSRSAWRTAAERPTVDALHDWRKTAKYHGYQCALMAELWPGAATRIADLKSLSNLLGWHHDLAAFSELLAPSRRSGLRAARARVTAEQDRALQRALRLGQVLFRRKPLAWFASPERVRK